jgi:hypothetical protein
MTARYGNRRIDKMRAEINALRDAIRAHDPEATETAWDKCEEWIDFVFSRAKLAEAG